MQIVSDSNSNGFLMSACRPRARARYLGMQLIESFKSTSVSRVLSCSNNKSVVSALFNCSISFFLENDALLIYSVSLIFYGKMDID